MVKLTAECLAEQSTRGPRYTSYPPATEFGPLTTEAVTRELATISAQRAPISLYVHIPFCRSLCAYCGCNVIPTRDKSRGESYVETLATELALLADRLGVGFPVSEIALGGGSPNFLEPPSLRRLMTAIQTYFSRATDARCSVELDPRSTTSAQIEAFSSLQFRALSVGVQDFSEPVQDAIRRHQTFEQTRWLIERARASGFQDVNIDIVYGLPRQTEESFTKTLTSIVELQPDRIALFGYAHLPSKLPHQILVERAGRVLDRYERASLLLLAIDLLTQAGYVHLGLDHFARPGSALARAATEHRLVRTFQGYVEHRSDTVLGVGTSAISSSPRMLWQSHPDLVGWQNAIGAGQLPVARGLALDHDDQIRRAVIGKLMCDGEVDLNKLGAELDIDASSYFAGELTQVAALNQLATYDPTTSVIGTTPLGRLLVRNICMVFDRYQHDAAEPRFSSTI